MKRIILVEDDEAIRDSLQLVLGKNFDLLILENGEKILSNQVDVPDLFILDKQISGTNGLDICRFVKANEKFKGVPVVMLSANPDIIALAKEAGADNAIAKPFTLKKLRETVSNLLEANN
ncbi:MAG TPA: response regulator [Niastella sp.]